MDIKISSNVGEWKNTTNDVQVRAGDMLIIPKAPSYVMVTGQVFNPTAVSYRPGKSAKWYLSQSGGPTQMANKKAIFVIRADGSVVSRTATSSVWGNTFESVRMNPGDTIVVPEKTFGPSAMRGFLEWSQLFSQLAFGVAAISVIQ